MSRASNTAVRRQQIIQGLMTVMAQTGYDGATIPLIANAAGLTPGLIHYHFDSKQSILIGLIDNLSATVSQRIEHLSKGTSGNARLAAFIDAHVGLGKGVDPQAVACWISIGAEAVRQTEVREQYQRATKAQLTMLEAICSQALSEAHKSTRKKREIALAILCAIEGAYKLLVSTPDLNVPGFAAPTIKAMANGLIESQPGAKDR